MPLTRDDVTRLFQGAFPQADWPAVMEVLDLYDTEEYERERERVQIAILNLSGADEQKLLHYISVAKQDYRDVLLWWEYPDPGKVEG